MCISCPEPHYKPRHSIPRCKIRQKIREISHFPQFIMVSALKLLIINSLAQSQRYRAVCFTRLISIRPIRAKVPSPGHYPGLQRAQPIRPERAKAPSPGQRPGLPKIKQSRPERAKASYIQSFCPFRATSCIYHIPRALPWARSFCPFRACWEKFLFRTCRY